MQGNHRDSSNHHVDGVLRHSRAIRDETGALVEDLRGAAEQLKRSADLKGRLERHPWSSIGIAVAAGYVIGGGLFTPLTARLLQAGTRLLLLPLLRSQMELFASGETDIQEDYSRMTEQ